MANKKASEAPAEKRTRYVAVLLTDLEHRDLRVRAAAADTVPYRLIRTLIGLEP